MAWLRRAGLLLAIALLRAPAALGQQGEAGAPEASPATRPHRAERRDGAVRLALGAGTDFPMAVGPRLDIEVWSRLRLSVSAGVLPGLYVDAINTAVVKMGGYDDDTARLVRRSLERAFVLRAHLGVRVWRGFYLDGGYGVATLGGSGTTADAIAIATGQPIPPARIGDRAFDIESTLHMLDVELGWQAAVRRAWRFRVAVGGAFTFSASSRVDPRYAPLSPQVASKFAREAEDYLNDVYRSYVHVPVVSLSVSRVLF